MTAGRSHAGADRRRLVVVIDSLERGGAELQLVQLLTLLSERGWTIELLTVSGKEPLAETLIEAGIRVHRLRIPSRGGFFMRTMRVLWLEWTLVIRLIAGPRPALYTVLPFATALAGPVALLLGRPLVVGRRSRNSYRLASGRVLRALETLALKGARAVIVNSEPLRHDLVSEGIRAAKVHVVPNGVDLSRCTAASGENDVRARLGIPSGTLVILCVANLFPTKGHSDLLQALALLRQDARSDWALVLVGRDRSGGAMRKELQLQARSLGIEDRVRFAGEQKEIAGLLSAADIAVCASHEEGLSNALLEAMAAGVASVSTDVGGHREALAEGRAGLIVRPKRPDELAAAIKTLMEHPQLRRELGAAAAARAKSVYDRFQSVERMAEIMSADL